MIEHADIARIATEVVNANTAPQSVRSVMARSSTGWTGEDVLRISIELAPAAADKLRGDTPFNILVQLQDRLQEAGETRFAIINYATTDELAAAGDDS